MLTIKSLNLPATISYSFSKQEQAHLCCISMHGQITTLNEISYVFLVESLTISMPISEMEQGCFFFQSNNLISD